MEKKNIRGGIILIIIGLALLLSKLNIIGEINILMIIGAVFIVAYIVFERTLGFLIPGCIVSAIGVFAYLNDRKLLPEDGGILFLFFLAGAFWIIMFVHTMWIKNADWGERFWPVFPAGIMTIIGFFTVSEVYYSVPAFRLISNILFPAILIILGIIIIFSKHSTKIDVSGHKSIQIKKDDSDLK